MLELLRGGGAPERVLVAEPVAASAAGRELRRRCDGAGVPVRVVPRAELDRLAPGVNHQGVVALTARYRYAAPDDLFAGPEPAVLFLDGVTDPHNLGSLLRSADGAGFGGVVVRAHGAAGVTAAVRRVSAGAAEVVPVARVANLGRELERAKQAGLWVVGLDARGDENLWATELLRRPVALVLGSEDRGMSRGVRERCDALVRIPLGGRLESLNVAVAGAVAMFEVARRSASSATL